METDKDRLGSSHRSRRGPPKTNEIISICHQALVKKEFYKDIAKKHNMSIRAICAYISKYKKDASYIDEL